MKFKKNHNYSYYLFCILRPAIHLSQNMKKQSRNAKNKMCIAGCCVTFFLFRPFSCVLHFALGSDLYEKSKDFVVYFFAALIKHRIHIKYEKCIDSVSYFVVCLRKHSQNAKYEKCIAGLTSNVNKNFFIDLHSIQHKFLCRLPQFHSQLE